MESVGIKIYITLFFPPFCSYDSREMTDLRPDRPDLWSEPSAFGDRAHFRVSTRPAVLSVTGVQRFDAGTYTCRVDFRQSPTVYHHVKLDVIGKQNFLGFTCLIKYVISQKNEVWKSKIGKESLDLFLFFLFFSLQQTIIEEDINSIEILAWPLLITFLWENMIFQ